MIWSKWVKDSTNSTTMACIGQSALPISSEFLLYGQVWRWLISLNTMQTVHNTRVRPVLAHTRLWTSSLITDMTRRNFLGTFLTSDIWIQFNQIFMSSDAHYQDILQLKPVRATSLFCTLGLLHSSIYKDILQITSWHHTPSLLNPVCRVPANKCTGWCLTNKIRVT